MYSLVAVDRAAATAGRPDGVRDRGRLDASGCTASGSLGAFDFGDAAAGTSAGGEVAVEDP